MGNAKDVWLVFCAVMALVSVSVNIYLLTDSPRTPAIGDGVALESTASGLSPAANGALSTKTAVAPQPLTSELRHILYQLNQSVKTTQEQVQELAARIPANPENARPSAQEIARIEAKGVYMRERLMLDVPEEERAMRLHERWLHENQEEIEAIARQVEQIRQAQIIN